MAWDVDLMSVEVIHTGKVGTLPAKDGVTVNAAANSTARDAAFLHGTMKFIAVFN
jgi:hypothetical protein